jgi:hypothetical protein
VVASADSDKVPQSDGSPDVSKIVHPRYSEVTVSSHYCFRHYADLNMRKLFVKG